MKVVLIYGRRTTEVGFSLSDLPIAVAIQFDSVPEELQLIMKAFVVTQTSGPMHQHGKQCLLEGLAHFLT
jgi:hypothetical protein